MKGKTRRHGDAETRRDQKKQTGRQGDKETRRQKNGADGNPQSAIRNPQSAIRRCPALLIGGVSSGVGKTSISLGIVRALARRGLVVQTFKVGPDFLDPSYLAIASGRTCYNLDGWMTGREYIERLFARVTADADVAVIEGVMGLFDGASPTTLEGSSAQIAIWLDAPVLLVANAHGAARSMAATVKGFAEFEPGVRLAGVIANHAGSERHRDWLSQALSATGVGPLIGAIGRGGLPVLPSRHLGLVTASADAEMIATIERLADVCEKCLDLSGVIADCGLQNADAETRRRGDAEKRRKGEGEKGRGGDTLGRATASVRIGIARDEAFHFYYADNLAMLREAGAELVEFSPLADRRLPCGLGGVYLGGGYPELYAKALGANGSMLEDVRRHVADGKAVYAECGGLMYLGQGIKNLDGKRFAMAGVIPIETEMLGKRKSLGYVEAAAGAGSMFDGAASGLATVLRGHEFHYSEIVSDRSAADGWCGAYVIRRRNGSCDGAGKMHVRDARATNGHATEGYSKGAVLASYVHVHFGSCPAAAERFVELCSATMGRDRKRR